MLGVDAGAVVGLALNELAHSIDAGQSEDMKAARTPESD